MIQVIYDPVSGLKRCLSPSYNYLFDSRTGAFARWGATSDDDPVVGYLEIFDLEVSTVCSGVGAGPCAFCYKSNGPRGRNMDFATFKRIFDLLPPTLTQIAFGIGDLEANPDLLAMFDYCRDNDHNPGVVPNLTINGAGLSPQWAADLAARCGAVAVSAYEPREVCYDAVAALSTAGLAQVNIHALMSRETIDRVRELISDIATDQRLAGVRALVLLALKPKGRGERYHVVTDPVAYRQIIDLAAAAGVDLGFDSCSAPTYLAACAGMADFATRAALAESCESDRFSGYANVDGQYWHCSFTEGRPGFAPVDLLAVKDFNREVWASTVVRAFRTRLLCRAAPHISSDCYLCPVYDLYDPALSRQVPTPDPASQI